VQSDFCNTAGGFLPRHTEFAALREAGFGPKPTCQNRRSMSAMSGIVLQKSKVGGLRIFRENKTQKAIADSY
jgi:hypothetical protein